jgi:O-antigen ligase
MKKWEEAMLHVGIVVIALLANRRITYEFSVPKYAFISLFALLIMVSLLFEWSKRNKFELSLHLSFANLLWFIFAACALLSTVYVFQNNRYYFRYSFDIALYTLLTAFMALYFSNRVSSRDVVTRLLLTFLATGMVVAIDGLLNFYTGTSIFFGSVGTPFDRTTIRSSVGNVIFVTNYLGMLLPVSIYFIISNNYGWKNAKKKEYLMVKIFSLVYFLLTLIVIAIGQTRSEYIALAIMVSLFAFFHLIYRKNKEREDPPFGEQLKRFNRIIFALLVVLSIVVLIVYNTDNPLTRQGEVSLFGRFAPQVFVSNAEERLLAWLSSVEQWKNSKWIGTGIGTYQIFAIEELAKVMEKHPRFLYVWNNFKRTHNDYFQVLGEMGILGFVTLLVLAVLLGVYALNRFKKLKSLEDFLLFLAMSVGFVGFMVQSFFSFPGHLLPNALLAIFYAAVATGIHFNPVENGFLSWRINLRGFKLAVALVAALFTVLSMTYLKWNYFVSEVYFKSGNNSYSFLASLDGEKNRLEQLEKTLLTKLEELENLSGPFVNLRPENFKIENLDPVEVEKRRISQIVSIRTGLANDLEKVRNGLKEIQRLQQQHSKLAKENLLKSVRMNHTYGKSHFYLASLALRGERISGLTNALKDGKTSVLTQNYDDYQSVIAPQFKTSDLLFLMDLKKSNPNSIDENTIAYLQAMIDSCALFKTSLLSFNERNTYKALTARYATLAGAIKQLRRQLDYLQENETNKETLRKLDGLYEKYRDEFIYWAKGTVYRLPDSWNRYPEWKNLDTLRAIQGEDIYRVLAVQLASFEPLTSDKAIEFLQYLARKEVWACESVAAKGVWGVPDGAAPIFLVAIQFLRAQDSVRGNQLLQTMRDDYKQSFERIAKELQNLDLKKTIDEYLQNVSKAIERILSKEDVASVKIKSVQSIIEGLSSQIESQFKSADWKIAISNELSAIQKGDVFKVYSLVSSLLNAMLNEVQRLLSNVIKDQNKLNQAVQDMTNVVNNVPMELKLWERYSRFVAFYSVLEEVSR